MNLDHKTSSKHVELVLQVVLVLAHLEVKEIADGVGHDRIAQSLLPVEVPCLSVVSN